MNLSGLSAVAGGYQDAQDKALQRQQLLQRMAIEQQNQQIQQAQIQRQQDADAADARMAGALPGAVPMAGPPGVAPTGQQPMPGQPSVPMQQPGSAPPPQMAGPPAGPQGPIPGAQPMPSGPPPQQQPQASPPPPQMQGAQPPPQGAPDAGGALPVDPSQNPDAWFKNWGMQQRAAILAADPQAEKDPKRFLADFHSRLEMLKQAEPFLKDRIEAVQKHIEQVHQQTVAQETQRHNRVDEGQAGARLGNENARLGLDRQRMQFEEQGKPQILTDPARKDADGNDIPATQYVYDATTKKATTLDGEPYHPGGAQKLGSGAAAGGGFGGGLKARYDQNMVRSGNEINRTLQMLDNVGSGVSGGVFSGSKKQGVGSWLGGKMTTEDQTDFNSAFAGADQEMGNMIRNGLGVSDSAAHEMIEGFKPVPSDTNYNRVFKLANMAAKAKTAIQSTFPVDPEAKASRDQLIHTLDQYPTPEEVRAARKAGGDIEAQTFGDAMRQIKQMGGGKAPGAAPTIVGPNGEKMTLSPDGKSWVPVK